MGWELAGVEKGFGGLLGEAGVIELDRTDVRGITHRGGTILGTTNRGNPFEYEVEEKGEKITKDFSGLCIENAKKLGIDAMVRGASPDRVVRHRAEGLLGDFIEAGRELVAQGADGLTTNCGFLSLFQAELAAAVQVPVATSSLMQAPLIQRLLPMIM